MHNIHCKGWAVTATYFGKVPYIQCNDLWQMNDNVICHKLKSKNYRNIKRLSWSLFLEGQMH